MKKFLMALVTSSMLFNACFAEDKPQEKKLENIKKQHQLNIKISGIPKGQLSLFVPLMIDTSILDLESVAQEDLTPHNIIAVASDSMSKAVPGIGILKLDYDGLPDTVQFRVYLKEVGQGQTDISLIMIAKEPTLLAKGAQFYNDINATISSSPNVEVTEKTVNGKKKLALSESKLKLNVQRPSQGANTIFIPIIFDKNIVDLEETFGHAVLGNGVSTKVFSQASLNQNGAGVEILLTEEAEKDFSIDVDLNPKGIGKSELSLALPQKSQTAIVRGPVVEISPSVISTLAKN